MNTEKNPVKFVAAIDIGTTKIVALIGEKKENGKIIIRDMATTPSRGVRRGEVINIEEAVNTIRNAVEALQLRTGILLSEVFVGIAGETIRGIRNRNYILRNNPYEIITAEEVNRLTKEMYKMNVNHGEEILHVLPQTFIVDNKYGVKSPVGMLGHRLDGNYHVVIAEAYSANIIERCIKEIGLTVNSLILEPLASARAVLTEEEKEAGVALIDIGGGTTDIAVYYDNIIQHTAVYPLGGNVITEDIKNILTILQAQAEELKIKHGSAFGDTAPLDNITIPGINGRESRLVSKKQLANIIQARMDEILEKVIFELENSGYYEKLGAGIVLTGGGALLKDLKQLVTYKTGLDVKIGFPGENLSAQFEKNNMNNPMYSTAVGLILEGYDYMEKAKRIATQQNEKREKNNDSMPFRFKFNILDNLKKKASSMFDEKDAEM